MGGKRQLEIELIGSTVTPLRDGLAALSWWPVLTSQAVD